VEGGENRLLSRKTCTNYRSSILGGIAQLVERLVRNEKARGSTPLTSTTLILNDLQKRTVQVTIPGYNKCGRMRSYLRVCKILGH
jgi:hypothetical protein